MAAYKYNTLATESVDWISSKGNKLNVTVALVQETSDYFGNGEYTPTAKDRGLSVTTTCAIDGKVEHCVWVIDVKNIGDVVARIGKIGLTAERVAEIQAATAKVKAHPAYVSLIQAQAEGERVESEYQRSLRKMDILSGADADRRAN